MKTNRLIMPFPSGSEVKFQPLGIMVSYVHSCNFAYLECLWTSILRFQCRDLLGRSEKEYASRQNDRLLLYWIYSSTKLNRLAFPRGPPFMTAQGNLSNFWEFVYHSWSVFRFLCRFKTFIKITVARTCNLTKIVSETQRERSPKWSHLHNSSWVFEIRCSLNLFEKNNNFLLDSRVYTYWYHWYIRGYLIQRVSFTSV